MVRSELKPLWLDADGVLFDWVRPFLKFIRVKESYDDLHQYNFKHLFNDDEDEMVRQINRFNETLHYARLEPLVSKEELQDLKNNGYVLNVISQVDGNYARHLRYINLEHVFGHDMFHTVILTGRKQKKVNVLRKLEPYETIYVVEDNPGFIRDAATDGHIKVMAIEHPYNKKELAQLRYEHNVPVYRDAKEIVHQLCRLARLK